MYVSTGHAFPQWVLSQKSRSIWSCTCFAQPGAFAKKMRVMRILRGRNATNRGKSENKINPTGEIMEHMPKM
jgi:hypothetical protein